MAAMRDRAALAFAPSVVKQPVFGELLTAAINKCPSQLLHCFVLPILIRKEKTANWVRNM
jgi:hypothetical protein